jgi:probable HAF family extracellular repeat protein
MQGHSQASLWVNGAARSLGGLGGADTYASGVNNQDQVAGTAQTPGGANRAVIYSAGGVTDVSLPGFDASCATSINDQGAIAGNALDGAMQHRAYTWSPVDGFTALGTLGGANSYAFGINNQGIIAGHSVLATGYTHAFVWDGTGLSDLGTLGGGNSYGRGVNDAGVVVGYSDVAGGSTHAFVYMDGVMWDLNALAGDLGGWELTEAYAINGAGQITGAGLLNGVEHAFLLDPVVAMGAALPGAAEVPEPNALWLVAIGVALLAGGEACRRRTRRAQD